MKQYVLLNGGRLMINNISYPSINTSYSNRIAPTSDQSNSSGKAQAVESKGECQACKERKYQDGSNENVSFKSPTHISPESAGSMVRAHEGEHVSNAYSKAAQKNGEVVRVSVAIHTAICPECGRSYVAGGTTSSMIKYEKSSPYQQNQKSLDRQALVGANVDLIA